MQVSKSTLPEVYRPMMGKPSVTLPHCAVCGRPSPLNRHHVVRRGAGALYDEGGREVDKPTVTLCGFGNNLADADGRLYCHGLAHANRLHFRWAEAERPRGASGRFEPERGGHWEFLITDEPTDYMTALDMEGWSRLWASE